MSNVRLNVQGLSRRAESLMRCIVADPGKSFVSSDLAAGEPTVICHYSGDEMYYAASFGMVGKAPHYRDDGILMIDDIYLMVASVSPMGQDKMREAFNTKWGGLSFAEKWLQDADHIKDALKADIRMLHKVGCVSGDTLVRVKDCGFKKIVEVSKDDLIWDGEDWVSSDGFIDRGVKPVIKFEHTYTTDDHKFLTDDGWRRVDEITKKEQQQGVYRKNLRRLQRPSGSWTDVWSMARLLLRSAVQVYKIWRQKS